MTRNEKKQRQEELVALLGLIALSVSLVALGWTLHGALETAAW